MNAAKIDPLEWGFRGCCSDEEWEVCYYWEFFRSHDAIQKRILDWFRDGSNKLSATALDPFNTTPDPKISEEEIDCLRVASVQSKIELLHGCVGSHEGRFGFPFASVLSEQLDDFLMVLLI